MPLSHDDVIRILELLRQSEFENLEYEQDGLTFVVRRLPAASDEQRLPAREDAKTWSLSPERSAKPSQGQAGPGGAQVEALDGADGPPDGLVVVSAPMVGTFFVAPEPGAKPFVGPGDMVDAGSTLALIEVMKMFTAVKAELEGRVEQVLVENGAFVEYGQELFTLRPLSV